MSIHENRLSEMARTRQAFLQQALLAVIRISGSFFSLPFSFSGPLAVSTVAVFLFGAPWVYRLNSMTSIAAEGFHGNGFLKRDCAMGSKKRAK